MSKLAPITYVLSSALILCASVSASAAASNASPDIKFAGALEFADDGTLFVGDNYNGAIYAFDLPAKASKEQIGASSIANIDNKIAELLGVSVGAIEINDLATHPVSNDLYISVTRIANFETKPVIVVVSPDRRLSVLDMASLSFQKQELTEFPDEETTFAVRGMGPGLPPLPRDVAKGDIAIRTLAIMDMEFYDDELFVAGVAHDNFLSSLRRIPYPFDGTQSIANVEMFHIVHDSYESRAPIRAMSVQQIDGEPQLVAAYTCSPIVLVPLSEIKDGAKIMARTILDYGNGQPLDMIPFKMQGQEMLFVTNDSRSPQVIPVAGLNGAKAVDRDDFERGPKLDLHPLMPFGPVGKTVMFDGVALHMSLVGEGMLASITRDGYTGNLNLDTNPTFFPTRIHNMRAEGDFPQ